MHFFFIVLYLYFYSLCMIMWNIKWMYDFSLPTAGWLLDIIANFAANLKADVELKV